MEALGTAGQRLAERLAYRPREVVIVGLLAAGAFGGLATEQWRARHPTLAAQLEAEPVRPTPAASAQPGPRARPRSVPARCEQPGARGTLFGDANTDQGAPRLDLNRATPGELARAAGISWRLAARIVAAREAFEGRESPESRLDERRPPAPAEPSAPETGEGDPPAATPDAESP